MSASNYLEQKLLQHLFNLASFAIPANLYVALSTANPGEDGSGIAEPVGNAYARVSTAAANWTWNAGATRVENQTAITFPTASGSWGTVTHFAIFDASSGGNMLLYAPLLASKAIGNGDTPSFAAGTLTTTAD